VISSDTSACGGEEKHWGEEEEKQSVLVRDASQKNKPREKELGLFENKIRKSA